METGVQIEHHPALQQVRDGTREWRGQDRERLALAVCFLASGAILWACGMIPSEEARGCRDGPRARGLAHVCARGRVALAGRCFGTRDHAAGGDNILDAGETRDVRPLIPS